MKYRAEIDGLRALAVVPVILFHAGVELFSGGFVGVDVFFVISGYLITTILVEDLENQRFSIANFYERRARRILPALFLIILVSIPAAWWLMLPSQLQDFSRSIVAVCLFASNILFWRESGYFEPSAEEKPLLHTWSLAVEEQYYVLFPVFLFFAWFLGKHKVFWLIVVFAAISLALSEWGWRHAAMANFYLAPTRAWELFAGSIAAFLVRKHGVRSNDTLSLLGLAAVVFSIFAYGETTPFPSLYALVPVLGVVLLVLFGAEDTFAAKLLSAKLFVGIGLISYSAYLWHQPIFAFARISSSEQPSTSIMLLLSIVSLALAVLSWRYVETPFRNRRLFYRKRVFTLSGICILAFLAIGVVLPAASSLRFTETQLAVIEEGRANHELMKTEAYDRYGCFFDYSQSARRLIENNCVTPSEHGRIILFGDSKAAHLYEGLLALNSTRKVMQFTGTSCRALDSSNKTRRCSEHFNLFFSQVVPTLSADDMVVVSSNWWDRYRALGPKAFRTALNGMLNGLKGSPAQVVLMTNAPEFVRDPYEILAMSMSGDRPKQDAYLQTQPIWRSDEVITELGHKAGVKVFNIASTLCHDHLCLFRSGDDYLYFDHGHFSYQGSEVVANALAKEVGL